MGKKNESMTGAIQTRHSLRPFSSKSPMKMCGFDYLFPTSSHLFCCRTLTKCNMGFHCHQLGRTSLFTDYTITLHSDYTESNIFESKRTSLCTFLKMMNKQIL